MNTIKFAEILSTLANLDPWLTSLGIRPNEDRVHHAIEVVHQAHERWKRLRETGLPSKIGNADNYYFGLVEALEFHDIFRAFKNENPGTLKPKLQRAFSGPLRPADETSKNSDGRNTMFELALAADLRLRGAVVSVGEPDIELTIDEQRFLIECKRPFREESIRANVRGAADQLKVHLGANAGAGGIIAISVSRVFNPGNRLFIAPSEQDRERLGDRLEELMRKHERDWRTDDLHPALAAVLFHVRTPGVLENRDLLTVMSYACLLPTGQANEQFI